MDGQVSYTTCAQLKRESIVRLMTVSKKNTTSPSDQATPCDAAADEPVSLVLVSAKGRVAVYDTSLKLAASFTLALSCASVAGASSSAGVEDAAGGTSAAQPAGSTPATKSLYKGLVAQKAKHLNGWITDCVHMDDSTLVVASSERCLHFFTTAATPYVERFRMDGMKDMPTALAYLAPGGGRTEPLLGVGDDGGDVFVLRFLKSSLSLFKKREVEREIQHVYWRELHLQAGMVTLTVLPGSHRSPVMQVDLKRTMQRVVSCSKNSFTSLAIRHIRHEASGTSALPSVVLRNAPGVACFDYDDERGLVVTGSGDGKIRLWSPTHLAKPWMVIAGHSSSIVGVLLVEQSAFLWSVCDQSELRYWDLDDGACLKNMQLSFKRPSGSNFQYGLRPLLALDSALYVACGDSIASVPLKRPLVRTSVHMWHETEGLRRSAEAHGTQKDAESKIPHRYREGLLDFGYRTEDEVFRKFVTDLQGVFSESTTVAQRLKEIERSETLVDGIDVQPTASDIVTYDWEVEFDAEIPAATDLVPLNQIKLRELEGVNQMRKHVKDGIPFCGLRLTEPQRCQLPKRLPTTSRMKKQGIEAFETLEEVRSANFDLFSERMVYLSSARTSIASSILSYYRQKKVSEKVVMAGDNELLVVTRSQQSSRKSSIVSVSALSSAPSIDNP